MSIEKIVEQALQDGYLTPSMEAEVGRICNTASELSIEEYMALDRLMGALLTGEVVVLPRKQFINVMEELVLSEAIARVAEIEENSEQSLDVGDIAAYALNRLPPLYATTEEGAQYQRSRAKEELQVLIANQVKEAIERNLNRAAQNQTVLGKSTGDAVLSQVSSLLQTYAQNYDPTSNITSKPINTSSVHEIGQDY
ncbi:MULTISPECIES: late competence development ComFB family protein [Planktothrix]|uniref:Late competence development ComFB family protein n=1 Tax=Planktothrix mougeotii LEGE 06226 TaxID=1828728 RepID=A0ABR9UBS1_9CYAN|nr:MULTISPECIES: late competence development ComFB family protein [Planktothrix]MBD2482938.1 late competence development ComFB family protein [Planktothrix sp. FACHB-1365]MBE9143903.1 late competence development ComFB family protein [Planktothrix mougeotii LEGE 06226]